MKKIGKFTLVGTASSERDANAILDEAKKNIANVDEQIWTIVKNSFMYCKVNFDVPEDYQNLKNKIVEIETKNGLSGNRLFYLATLPDHFESITYNLSKAGLVGSKEKIERVIYEKPFGNDLASAKKINACISKIFDEKNIYRADHYLGKELVANIALLRFTNRILEPLWSRRDVDSVQIILDENFGIKNRGKYYDTAGALKDMMQSHALQILALLAMESPDRLTGEHIRQKKADVLKMTKITDIIFGQYEGYKNEQYVQPDSKTDTFFAAKLEINNSRWRGVPFYIRAGKNLAKKQTIAHIRFKGVECLLSKTCPSDNNYLTIRVEPNEGFAFEVNSKAKTGDYEIQTIDLDYDHKEWGEHNMDAYVVLIEQALRGEQSFFIGRDEVEYSWKIVDAVKKDKLPVYQYKVGENGPKELETWSQKNNIFWKS